MSTALLRKQLAGDVTRDDLCSGCCLPRHLHLDTTGDGHLGCDCAAARMRLGLLEDRRSHLVEGSDLFPALTRVLADTLRCDSGVALTSLYALLGQGEQLQIARNLARRVMAEYQTTAGRV